MGVAGPACFRNVFSDAECRGLAGEIGAAPQEQVKVWVGDGFGFDPRSRSGTIASIDRASEGLVHERVWGVVPALERDFGCETAELSGVTALGYGPGDHFAAHSDGGLDDEAPDEVRRRRVSLVVALNDGSRDFSGGELRFFPRATPNTLDDTGGAVSVRSEPGMLVAFASPTVHQVMPVGDGWRYSLALWALAP